MNTHFIMRRVYTIWLVRSVLSPLALKLYGIVLSLFFIGRLVFVERVFDNAPSFTEPLHMFQFASSAFFHTEVSVQFFVASLLALSAWAFFGIVKRVPIFERKRLA